MAVGVSFGVIKVKVDGQEYDFSLPRRDSKTGQGHRGFMVTPDHALTVAEAAARRDYTINAISRDSSGMLHDPYNGQRDLQTRTLRHVSMAFGEDALRVLRGMQFAGRFDLTVTQETARLCRSLRSEYPALSKERIWGEWEKWASKSVKPSAGLTFLYSTGWLWLYPELAALVRLPQEADWHPEGTVWQHTKYVCDAAARLAQDLSKEERTIAVLAALCHDLGKATTTKYDVFKGRITSYGHDVAGVEPTRSFLTSIGAPQHIVSVVCELTRYHMHHVHGEPSPRTARTLLAGLKEAKPAMLFYLMEADHSGRPPLPPGLPEAAQKLQTLVADQGNKFQRILMGRHLVALGWTPNRHLGNVLAYVEAMQIEGTVSSLAEALTAAEALR